MKAILMSNHAKWCALMMNGDKTIEVRKGTALYKAIQKLIDENGYADIYVYNTRDERYRLDKELNGKYFVWDTKSKDYPFDKTRNRHYFFGKVIFKFRCYKVEEIPTRRFSVCTYPYTETLDDYELLDKSCLSIDELEHYLEDNDGCAIHISDLEIFDRPKELYELHKPLGSYDCNHNCGGGCDMCWCEGWETRFHFECEIQKAPQSWCYVEVGE